MLFVFEYFWADSEWNLVDCVCLLFVCFLFFDWFRIEAGGILAVVFCYPTVLG